MTNRLPLEVRMHHDAIRGVLVLIVLAAAALGQPPFRRGPSEGRPPPVPPEQLLRDFDRDGDGRISRAEAPGRMREHWNSLDTNNDGYVSFGELRARDVRQPGGGRPPTDEAPTPTVPAQITGRTRIYVQPSATGMRDGKSWATALATVQEGIDAATEQSGGEVWVATGTYKPTKGSGRDATIQLRAGVALYGGFAGTETKLSERRPDNASVLSGDIGRPGVATDNVYHVVTGANNALIDGFTITGGYGLDASGPGRRPPGGGSPGAQGGPPPRQNQVHTTPDAIVSGAGSGFGAGLLNFQTAPTVRNCIFRDNQAGKGGAVYNMLSRSFPPRPEATPVGPLFEDCQFIENHARGRGGAIANDLGTSPTLRRCTLLRNTCDEKGGAIYNDFGCSPTLVNCLLAENRAASAAAMGNDGGSSPRIVQCTFARNTASEEGAAIYQGTGPANNPVVVGCILWDDRCEAGPAEVFNWHDNEPRLTNCCVQGGYPGEGNVTVDPRFVDAEHGDYRLQAGSPCANLGYTGKAREPLPGFAARPARPERGSAAAPPTARASSNAVAILRVQVGNASHVQDGRTWPTAYRSLTTALAAARGKTVEIWIAAGTYCPTDRADRSASFLLGEGCAVYGGFAGNETRRDQRDFRTHLTVLSGDIGKPDDASDNSYHVLVGADGTTVDGIVVRDGNADGNTYDAKGAGMINYRRTAQAGPMGAPTGFSPTVQNCVFLHNRAREGGAVYNYDRGEPRFTSCRFVENCADYGGAIVDRVGVRSKLTDCEFLRNTAQWRAGAIYLDYGARPELNGCRFQENRSQCHGGAIATISRASQLEATIATLTKCVFDGNRAEQRGGAIANSDQSVVALDNCAFTGNRAGTGGGIANTQRASSVLIGCQFSGNEATAGKADVSTDARSSVSHSRSDWPDLTEPEQRPPGRP